MQGASSVAYDLSMFDEKINKDNIKNITNIIAKKKQAARKRTLATTFVVSFCILVFFSFVIYNHSYLTELNNQNSILTSKLNTLKNNADEYRLKIDKQMNLSTIERDAVVLYGMQKINPSQVTYVSFDNGDKAEILNSGNHITDKIHNAFATVSVSIKEYFGFE